MARWRELPESLDPRVRQFVVQLRRLKDRSGLSLASLAGRTGVSRSSWERYLNGKALPPPRAVEELARVTGAEPTRLAVLREVAEEAWRQQVAQDAPAPPPVPGPVPVPDDPDDPGAAGGAGDGPRAADVALPAPELVTSAERERAAGVRRPVAFTAVAAAALVGLAAGLLVGTPWDDDGGDGGGAPANAVADTSDSSASASPGPSASTSPSGSPSAPGNGKGPYVFRVGKTYPCEVRRADAVDGGLAAGYSVTRTAVLAGPGWDVVEAQCLLRHHRMKPGTVDGVYGQQTIAAVMRLQKKAGIPADGVVGPHTWRVLRG
ncbi:helix-turn-helix domain-containing protein [Streptomyces sp. MAR4 CNX-425]|uniref:helix-turn-helix domain-containing protein n=1 Tax=Streptomyces sp. MAR4 CNX-425 TaxID=3406343 RepID=UPI003B509ED5